MRNISLSKITRDAIIQSEKHIGESPIPQTRLITTLTTDPEEDAVYVAVECRTGGEHVAGIDTEIWKVPGGEQIPSCIARHNAPPASSVSSLPDVSRHPETISLHLLLDTRALALITRAGDLVTIQLSEDGEQTEPEVEVVGSVEDGLRAAAWSPDSALLALITGGDKQILMTSTFDVLSEGPLHPAEFGADAPTALGWGAKHTQFHGSLGKRAAAAAATPIAVGMSPDDDKQARISWRGDGAYFVVSALEEHRPEGEAADAPVRLRRKMRVYDREGSLSSTSEPVPGLEHSLAWRPSGNLIVGTQRFAPGGGKAAGLWGLGEGREGRHDVVFFERNGLRHGEFGLREWAQTGQVRNRQEDVRRWGYRVREVGWSADSNVLSVWLEGAQEDVVQLWTTSNYHWYLKQEIAAPRVSSVPPRFTTVSWHPENALRLVLTTSTEIIQRTYAWETFSSSSKPPVDSGSVAVFDGLRILLTPFRTQNVPPPMSAHILELSGDRSSALATNDASAHAQIPIHASFSARRDLLAVLWETGLVELYDLRTHLGPGRGKVMDPLKIGQRIISPESSNHLAARQVVFVNGPEDEAQLAVLYTGSHDVVRCVSIKTETGEVTENFTAELAAHNGRLVPAEVGIIWQDPCGALYAVERTRDSSLSAASFSEFCFSAVQCTVPSGESKGESEQEPQPSLLYIGLSSSGRLYVVQEGVAARTLSSNVNSFTVASGFLIFTTTAHVAQFAPLSVLSNLLSTSEDTTISLPEWETRRVERGSRIVAAVPSTMSLVLQMPRGNLETINPRPMVMEIVRQDIDSANYRKAFLACRKHRIDLNVLIDHNREAFKQNLPHFVKEVDDVDYINLFLTSLGQGSLPAGLVSELCDGIRLELEKRDLKRYISSILTAYIMKRPPDHEAGLALLLRLRDSEPQLVEDAVKYIIFLVDADKLFDTALGMYDFSLVLMIAQHAQKDPREYLPFLRELRALDYYYQRFRIDDHLRRHQKALQNLSQAGSERFDEAMRYVEQHQLYDLALSIWKGTDCYESVLNIYGEWLFERREFKTAAFIFRSAKKVMKAMIAHEKALDWEELFELALQEQTPAEDIVSMAYRVAEDLASRKRYLDAARVLLDYAEDVKEAVTALVEGRHFAEARRIIALKSHPGLLIDLVHPGALECRAQIADEIGEMRDQLRKQVQRLRELKLRKVEEPDAFYGVEDMDLHNVDVMTDVSMAATAFTRYTQAPSSVSRASTKRSSRSKRKLERKVGSGRKGTVDEEEYLLKSVTKLVGRFNSAQADTANLLPHLFQFTEEYQNEGKALQKEVHDFEMELQAAVEEIWKKPSGVGGEENAESELAGGWAARMQEYEKQRQIDPLEKVSKPELAKPEWSLQLPVTV
ncbi:IkappaB kinase complex IKAP component [Wolfiporia cocos MD-104 SS10]|uniref:Elongator complex protein 1 n=1 Tax=Wolfiporia cocos (strain MD-104) TaxID=742152 RepID=A0A2H3JIX7_WOLCO|nr:IkappaB kinase complex IKAP component [Wolfiporia cocos MD-104 SS10]